MRRLHLLLAFGVLAMGASLSSACGDSGSTTGGGGDTGPQAIDAPDDAWTFVDFPDSTCMDGSATGIGINPTGDHKKLFIYLAGGNACFNAASCKIVANADGYGKDKFDAEQDLAGRVFDRTNPDNPFKDYSYVYVPYCTGDAHAGNKDDVEVAGKVRQFHGYGNMTAYLERLKLTFPDATQIVLSGYSAGGFGAFFNYDQVATTFDPIPVDLLDDSGPPMSSEYVPACLQKHFVDTWGFDKTLCEGCVDPDGVFMENFVKYTVGKYPDATMGLISSTEDHQIRLFWGFGENDCASIDSLPPPYDPAKYEAGLMDLRDRILVGSAMKTFYIAGTDQHVWLGDDPTTVTVGTVTLKDWLTQLVTHDTAFANVPAN